MDIKEIRRIVQLMESGEVSEFEMEEEGFRLAIKRKTGSDQPVVVAAPAAPAVSAVPSAAPAPAAPASASAPEEDDGLVEVTSPIVGTFYRSPSPEADPFVKVGDEVEPDTVVCIVEAMKVMNEIQAEVRGVVKKILVDNATPIEYGQPLFKIEPA
jgi:acetyl-CoA carboxylase biotin carboxyl carrier protein